MPFRTQPRHAYTMHSHFMHAWRMDELYFATELAISSLNTRLNSGCETIKISHALIACLCSTGSIHVMLHGDYSRQRMPYPTQYKPYPEQNRAQANHVLGRTSHAQSRIQLHLGGWYKQLAMTQMQNVLPGSGHHPARIDNAIPPPPHAADQRPPCR